MSEADIKMSHSSFDRTMTSFIPALVRIGHRRSCSRNRKCSHVQFGPSKCSNKVSMSDPAKFCLRLLVSYGKFRACLKPCESSTLTPFCQAVRNAISLQFLPKYLIPYH